MHSIRIIAFAVALAASVTAASAVQWRRSNYAIDGFSVDFSSSVKVEPTPLNEETKKRMVRSTIYMQDGSDAYAYIVGATLVAPESDFNVEAGVRGTMDTYKCTKTESDTTSPTAEGSMREIYASSCFGSSHRVGARFFIRGRWFYQVIYIVTSDAQIADAKRFLTSFKLIPLKN